MQSFRGYYLVGHFVPLEDNQEHIWLWVFVIQDNYTVACSISLDDVHEFATRPILITDRTLDIDDR